MARENRNDFGTSKQNIEIKKKYFSSSVLTHDIVIVGAGAAGVAAAASLLVRDSKLDIAIIDAAAAHYYQPGWTLVGAGVISPHKTARDMTSVIPPGVVRIAREVVAFAPETSSVILNDGRMVIYERLIVCPGLKTDWESIEGLADTLGRNGVTSNYRYDLAQYTWQLVRNFQKGRAIFTQPPMPIKCAGAPQKAMYLSADHWARRRVVGPVDIEMFTSGNVLFGVADYVPALMDYVKRYHIALNFGFNLFAVDGKRKCATFRRVFETGEEEMVTRQFDMIHVVPPQTAPDFIRSSPLVDGTGWVDVDPNTLQHPVYSNIFALGDVTNTPNAKTAAAARKQAPVVAHNVLRSLGKAKGAAIYDGYGSCPLTVERGRVVLAEFLYGGEVAPTLPSWLIDGTRPSKLAWAIKARLLPEIYWHCMLKGREWFATPKVRC